jgi:hypothetical protein
MGADESSCDFFIRDIGGFFGTLSRLETSKRLRDSRRFLAPSWGPGYKKSSCDAA